MSENDTKIDLQPKCGAGIDNRRRIKTLEDDSKMQWEAIDKLRNRPPIWATAVISLLTFLKNSRNEE